MHKGYALEWCIHKIIRGVDWILLYQISCLTTIEILKRIRAFRVKVTVTATLERFIKFQGSRFKHKYMKFGILLRNAVNEF